MASTPPQSFDFVDDASETMELADVKDTSMSGTSVYPDPETVLSRDPYGYKRKSDCDSPIPQPLIEAFGLESDNTLADSSESREDNHSVDVTKQEDHSNEDNSNGDESLVAIEYPDCDTHDDPTGETDNTNSKKKKKEKFIPRKKGLYAWMDESYVPLYIDWNGTKPFRGPGPSMIGEHVWSEFNYGRKLHPRKTPFVKFDLEHLFLDPLCEEEVSEMREYGVKVSEAGVTRGEWNLMHDERLNVHRCIPSGLRKRVPQLGIPPLWPLVEVALAPSNKTGGQQGSSRSDKILRLYIACFSFKLLDSTTPPELESLIQHNRLEPVWDHYPTMGGSYENIPPSILMKALMRYRVDRAIQQSKRDMKQAVHKELLDQELARPATNRDADNLKWAAKIARMAEYRFRFN
ncbi:hypothetical protein BKA64DRAFT_703357 [Cadophora sp. MPI-SDFR-AT-0126]|nr:hypothetical protein BKA64DRAFT_703357 [Leotiomycetes sp. MPI-SDFR-AT-0126]